METLRVTLTDSWKWRAEAREEGQTGGGDQELSELTTVDKGAAD